MRAGDGLKKIVANHLHDLHRERRPDSMEKRKLGSRLEAFRAARAPARRPAAPVPDLFGG